MKDNQVKYQMFKIIRPVTTEFCVCTLQNASHVAMQYWCNQRLMGWCIKRLKALADINTIRGLNLNWVTTSLHRLELLDICKMKF